MYKDKVHKRPLSRELRNIKQYTHRHAHKHTHVSTHMTVMCILLQLYVSITGNGSWNLPNTIIPTRQILSHH